MSSVPYSSVCLGGVLGCVVLGCVVLGCAVLGSAVLGCATEEQFGFCENLGCLEAVVVLLALICSRIHRGRRLYVLWLDLRTAFPSMNRAILIRRMFLCGMEL